MIESAMRKSVNAERSKNYYYFACRVHLCIIFVASLSQRATKLREKPSPVCTHTHTHIPDSMFFSSSFYSISFWFDRIARQTFFRCSRSLHFSLDSSSSSPTVSLTQRNWLTEKITRERWSIAQTSLRSTVCARFHFQFRCTINSEQLIFCGSKCERSRARALTKWLGVCQNMMHTKMGIRHFFASIESTDTTTDAVDECKRRKKSKLRVFSSSAIWSYWCVWRPRPQRATSFYAAK